MLVRIKGFKFIVRSLPHNGNTFDFLPSFGAGLRSSSQPLELFHGDPSAPSASCICIFERFVGETRVESPHRSNRGRTNESAQLREPIPSDQLTRKISDVTVSPKIVKTNVVSRNYSKKAKK